MIQKRNCQDVEIWIDQQTDNQKIIELDKDGYSTTSSVGTDKKPLGIGSKHHVKQQDSKNTTSSAAKQI